MNDTMDLLQIKIEKAKSQLSEDTLQAIAAVPWQATILKMRETRGYSFEQLNDLEIETELVLCGLLSPADYPKELESRMRISRAAAEELVNEMNAQVFTRIKEELIKNIGRKKLVMESPPAGVSVAGTPIKPMPGGIEEEQSNKEVLKSAGIEIMEKNGKLPVVGGTPPAPQEAVPVKPETKVPEKPAPAANAARPIFIQKLSGPLQVPPVKTEHTLDNITKVGAPAPDTKAGQPRIDPYREMPE